MSSTHPFAASSNAPRVGPQGQLRQQMIGMGRVTNAPGAATTTPQAGAPTPRGLGPRRGPSKQKGGRSPGYPSGPLLPPPLHGHWMV